MKILSLLILVFVLIFSIASAEDTRIFKFDDPRGDDRGDGTIIYPTNGDLRAGDLDLVSFSARVENGGTLFEAEFANPIDRPDTRVIDAGGRTLDSVARLGFYAFNIDVYIDMDRKEGSGFTSTLPGRNVLIDPKHAWEKVIFLNPRPNDARAQLRKMLQNRLEEKMRTDKGRVDPEDQQKINADIAMDLDAQYFLPSRVRVISRKVNFFVPDYFLRGPAQKEWSYVVVVTAATIEDKIDLGNFGLSKDPRGLMNLPVGPGGWSDRLGSSREETALLPPILDVIVPNGMKQQDILRGFNVNEKRLATIPGVVPSPN